MSWDAEPNRRPSSIPRSSCAAETPSQKPLQQAIKRGLDKVAALLLLVVLLPVLAATAAAIFLTMGRPFCFRQARSGRYGVPFTLFKFRTMAGAWDGQGRRIEDARRLTPLGRLLRASSLDELPQLWNVLRGEMSLVGPRPLLLEYLGRYNQFERRRLEVTPGITGWAQIHGRNALAWEARFRLDVWYVDHWSLLLDCRILWRTVSSVLRHQGISAPVHATMPEFQGSASQPPPAAAPRHTGRTIR